MKKLTKKTFALLLSLAILAAVFPVSSLPTMAETSGDYEYSVIDETAKTCEITLYTGSGGNVVIPSTLGGYAVTKIGDWAFEDCMFLTSITMGNSVTSIGLGAFWCCTSLTSVTIPDSVTSIGDGAFDNCDNLQYNIHDNAKYLGNETNPYVVLMEAENQEITACEIHPNTKVIYGGAFSGCTSLTSVTIPNLMTRINDFAFVNCTSLTSITISYGVTEIGDYAFRGCTSLTNVTIPDSVTTIEYGAFDDCDNLQYNVYDNAKYLGNETNPYVVLIGAENWEITACEIHPNTKVIYNGAFEGCTSLTSVTIPDSVTSIGCEALGWCTSLTSITIPDSVTKIGEDAFENCTSLTSVTIGNSVTEIGWGVFEDCTSLPAINVDEANTAYTSQNGVLFTKDMKTLHTYPAGKPDAAYVIPDGVTTIDDYAFEGCASLTSVTIPNGVTSICDYAFWKCKSLTAINVDAANTAYASHEGVLYNKEMTEMVKCPEGKTGAYTVPEGVTYIYFLGCTSLTNITIPNSMTEIGDCAFEGCTSLTSVTIPDSVTEIGWDAFKGCSSLTSVTIPDSVTEIGRYAFSGCTSLTNVTIPDSVTEIYGLAFSGCTALTDVYYAGTEAQWKAIEVGDENDLLLNVAIHYNCVPVERTFADEAAGVSVTGSVPNIIPEGAALKAEKTGTTEDGVVYDISLVRDGAKVQPRGSVSVKIPVPDGLDGSTCKVYRVEADGSYKDMNAAYDGAGFLVFSTDHFSKYLVTDKALGGTLGDANDDGEVDNLDAAVVLQYDAGIIDEADIANFDFSDTNGDGEVDNLDAAMILQYDAGLIEGF